MSPTMAATVSCPACRETNRAGASFCRACGAAVARHANAYTWVSRIATVLSLIALALVVLAAGVGVVSYSSSDAGISAVIMVVAGILWFISSVVAFTFGGWSTAGLRARRSWATVVLGIVSRLMACAVLMIFGGMLSEYSYYYGRYRDASDAAQTYRRQLEQNNIKPEGYFYY